MHTLLVGVLHNLEQIGIQKYLTPVGELDVAHERILIYKLFGEADMSW